MRGVRGGERALIERFEGLQAAIAIRHQSPMPFQPPSNCFRQMKR
jgi:hypothetical protein